MKNINLFLLIFFSFTFLQAGQHYQVFDISPRSAFSSEATDINDQGVIVGVYSLTNKSHATAFLWDKEKGFQDLVDLKVDSKSSKFTPPKINNLGHVIGTEMTGGTWRELWTTYQRPFIWTPEKGKRIINPRPKGEFVPLSINDHDQVLMIATYPCGCEPHRFWVWQEGSLGEFDEIIKKINPQYLSNDQIIVGSLIGSLDNEIKAPLESPLLYNFQDKSVDIIPYPEGMKYGTVLMINNKGEALLVFREKPLLTSTEKYYLYNVDTGLKELPAGFLPLSLNNHGEIIGLTKSKNMTVDIYERGALKKTKISSLEKTDQFHLYENGDLQKITVNSDDPDFVMVTDIVKMNDGRQLVGKALYSVRGHLQQRAVFLVPTEDSRLIYRLKNLSGNAESPRQ